jgi:DNA (cytosine-5)-methyltransferase 1
MVSILSLCSGVGALDLAVAAHYGAEVRWVSETDPEASQVLAARFPDVPNLGDLKTIEPTFCPDILVSGFPCGPVAPIGKQKGPADERWVCDEIVELIAALPQRPKRLVFENVVGLLSNKNGETVRSFLWALAELGFTLEWQVVQARDAEAPHRRSRVFVVGSYADDGQLQRRRNHSFVECPTAEERRARLAALLAPVVNSASLDRSHDFDFGKFEPAIKKWERALGVPAPLPIFNDRLSEYFSEWLMGFPGWVTGALEDQKSRFRLTGNAVVPQQALLALSILDGDS